MESKITWIRCKDQMPPNTTKKLVCTLAGGLHIAFYDCGWWDEHLCPLKFHVSHWAELPDAPER